MAPYATVPVPVPGDRNSALVLSPLRSFSDVSFLISFFFYFLLLSAARDRGVTNVDNISTLHSRMSSSSFSVDVWKAHSIKSSLFWLFLSMTLNHIKLFHYTINQLYYPEDFVEIDLNRFMLWFVTIWFKSDEEFKRKVVVSLHYFDCFYRWQWIMLNYFIMVLY